MQGKSSHNKFTKKSKTIDFRDDDPEEEKSTASNENPNLNATFGSGS